MGEKLLRERVVETSPHVQHTTFLVLVLPCEAKWRLVVTRKVGTATIAIIIVCIRCTKLIVHRYQPDAACLVGEEEEILVAVDGWYGGYALRGGWWSGRR